MYIFAHIKCNFFLKYFVVLALLVCKKCMLVAGEWKGRVAE